MFHNGAASSPRLALHDPTGFGHAPNLLAGLVAAATTAGLETVVYSPTRPGSIGSTDPDSDSGRRGTLTDTGDAGWQPCTVPEAAFGPARRRFLADIAARAGAVGATNFVVTTFDGYLLSAGARLVLPDPSVVVLHSAHPYQRAATAKQRARREITRSATRGLARRGVPIVVHSHAAAAAIRAVVAEADVRVLAYPVRSRAELIGPNSVGAPEAGDVRLLFPGEPRDEKGFPLVIEALRRGVAIDTFEISGRISRAGGRQLQALGEVPFTVAYAEAGSGQAEYHASLSRASLAVLPLTEWYTTQGRVSAALLDVVARGVPLVTTPAARPLIPAGYEGAIVIERADPAALADGIGAALGRLGELTDAARSTGPLATADHTYDVYLEGLRRAMTR